MKIGIDARFLGPENKGLGRYVQKLVENLDLLDKKNKYFIFLRKDNFDLFKPTNPNFKKVLADYKWYSFSEQIFMPFLLRKYKLDFVHFPHFNIPIFYFGKILITVHDLILLRFPTKKATTRNKLFYLIKFLAYKLTIFLAIKRATKIMAVSNFTKDDLREYYNLPEEKLAVTYEAVDNDRNLNEDKIFPGDLEFQKTELNNFFLYVGNAYPHKNLDRMILAFDKWKKKFKHSYKLVLVGKNDYFYKCLQDLIKKENIKDVIIFNTLNDKSLYKLYKKAKAFLFLSLFEGFGLPPLEAMREGVPVLSSDHQVMLEVLGKDNALFCDGKNINDIIEKMEIIVTDERLQKNLIEKGKIQAKKYSWKKMAEETLEAYNEAGNLV